MPRTGRMLHLRLCALAAALFLFGCEDEEAAETESSEAEPEPVWSVTPPVPEQGDVMDDRLPAEPGRTILVPSANLFPGASRIDPGIENPYAGDADAIAAGERHFAAFNCAGCHAPLGGGGMGPPLSDDEWIYGSEPAQIYLTIMHGRPAGMPAWGSMLPAKTVWELVAYIETLDEIEDYAARKGFDENVGGFRDTEGEENEEESTQSENGGGD